MQRYYYSWDASFPLEIRLFNLRRIYSIKMKVMFVRLENKYFVNPMRDDEFCIQRIRKLFYSAGWYGDQ